MILQCFITGLFLVILVVLLYNKKIARLYYAVDTSVPFTVKQAW